MMEHYWPTLALAFLMAGSLAGCGSLNVGEESAAKGVHVHGNGNQAMVSVEGTTNNNRAFGLLGPILPFIPFWNSGENTSSLTVYLKLVPVGNGRVSIDPLQITLITKDGERLHPSEVKGPFAEKSFLERSSYPVTVSEKISVHLFFPVSRVSPDHRFNLILEFSEPHASMDLTFTKQTSLNITYTWGLLCPHCGEAFTKKWALN
jgi:hypothetical protein